MVNTLLELYFHLSLTHQKVQNLLMTKFVKSVFISLVCFLLVGCSDNLSSRNEQDNSNHSPVQTSNCTFKDIKSEDNTISTINICLDTLPKEVLLDSIRKNLNSLYAYNEIMSPKDFDPYKIAPATANMIVYSVNNHQIDVEQDIPQLHKSAKLNGSLATYCFGFTINGTKGYYDISIVVWKHNNHLQAISFPMISFYNISILNRTNGLYLLLGSEKLDGACQLQTAYVMQFEDGVINLNYPAFAGSPKLSLCSPFNLSYNEINKTLTYKTDYLNNLQNELLTHNDSLSATTIYPWIVESYFENFSFSLKFNGNAFCAE